MKTAKEFGESGSVSSKRIIAIPSGRSGGRLKLVSSWAAQARRRKADAAMHEGGVGSLLVKTVEALPGTVLVATLALLGPPL